MPQLNNKFDGRFNRPSKAIGERRLKSLERGIFTVWQNDGSWMRKRESGDSGRCNGRSNAIVERA